MAKNGPVILIDDDGDGCEILADALQKQSIPNRVLCFSGGGEAIRYLRTTTDKPFLILCDINMPVMNGIDVRKAINEDDYLRRKSIPFVFYTTSATAPAVNEAYEMSVQGYFEKEHSAEDIGRLLRCIYDYWHWCRHPNT